MCMPHQEVYWRAYSLACLSGIKHKTPELHARNYICACLASKFIGMHILMYVITYNRAACDLLKKQYVTIFGKIDHLRASNEIHFLPVQERYIHALSRNTNCLTIDGQVCFYRRLFTDAVKPQGCISRNWGVLIGLHGVLNCSSRQSWPPLWIVSVHVTF